MIPQNLILKFVSPITGQGLVNLRDCIDLNKSRYFSSIMSQYQRNIYAVLIQEKTDEVHKKIKHLDRLARKRKQ